ncbi:MAG TPA: tetratricopeptide repeat protein [Candidatus Eisenbacteria bacterium]|nr:tetratricopeptide repeat protein [Candidatus Eisenbacteria bacterium]
MKLVLALSIVLACLPTAAGAAPDASAMARADTLFAHHQWSDAAAAYRSLARAEPSNVHAWIRLGACATSLSSWDEAADAYQKAEALGGLPVLVEYNLACAYARGGAPDSAFAALDRLMNHGYGQLHALQSDTDFASLKPDPRWAKVVARCDHNARPCSFTPESRQFDFWVGDWNVRSHAGGQFVGSSHVDLILGDCVIFENWTGALGGTGKSLNAWNPECSCWQQSWMDNTGHVTLYSDGHLVNDAMVLVAQKGGSGSPPGLRRLSFFHLGSDQVRQLAESSMDGGKTWQTVYDFDYFRKPAVDKASASGTN